MIKIIILGDIGSGKSFIAKNFGYPVFNADEEVAKLYKRKKKIFIKLKKILPNYINSYPIEKSEITNAILANKFNLSKIIKIVHYEVRKKMNSFLKKHSNKKIVILDVPLYLENQLDKKNDIFIFVQSKKFDILNRLKKRKNFNINLWKKFKNIQLPIDYKKKKSNFMIKNNFSKKTVINDIKKILEKILS
tara:strand:- start:693 stop:1265 length:573 start_codon:yes stop_codon:yes gene_type:complete